MKKLSIAAICAALALALTGCENTENVGEFDERFAITWKTAWQSCTTKIITDNETGVKYLFVKSGYGG